MAIADKLTYLNETKQAIKQAIIDKGVEVTDTDTFRSYADKVGEISGGSGGSDILGVPYTIENGVVSLTTDEFEYVLPSNITDLPRNALYYRFGDVGKTRTLKLTKVSMPSLKRLTSSYSLAYMGYEVPFTSSVDISNLEEVSGAGALNYAFKKPNSGANAKIEVVDLDKLVSITGSNAFYGTFGYCSVNTLKISKLETINANMVFNYCFINNKFGTISFDSLKHLTGDRIFDAAYTGGTIKHIYFPSLTASSFGTSTTQFKNMLSGVTGCTVHFPSNIESVIGGWSDVTAGFGGTNTTVLFDIHSISVEVPDEDDEQL